jgi:hypothetical protein
MAAKNNATTTAAERELVITRLFDAPRQLVFKVVVPGVTQGRVAAIASRCGPNQSPSQ